MLIVRAITADDWSDYRKVRINALKESPQAFGSTWQQEVELPDEDWLARATASESGQFGRGFFAAHSNKICGLAWCLLSDTDPPIAHVYSMWTSPAVRGQGAGRALLQQCMAWAREKGACSLVLSVAKVQAPAIHLYRSHGFYTAGESGFLRPDSDIETQKMRLDINAGA